MPAKELGGRPMYLWVFNLNIGCRCVLLEGFLKRTNTENIVRFCDGL